MTDEAYDSPVRVGRRDGGHEVTMPLPGIGGMNVLVGGATGSGKSGLVNVVASELAPRPHLALVLGDPKRVELAPLAPRASLVAKGRLVQGELLDLVVREMVYRYHWMEREGYRKLPVASEREDQVDPRTGRPWPYLLTIFDELADLSRHDGTKEGRAAAGRRIALLTEGIQMGRAAGLGFLLCTQRPSADVVPLDIRDNCRVRVAFGTESQQQSAMILGDYPEHVRPQDIPASFPGVAWLKVDRGYTYFRTFVVDDDLARHRAEQNATLRVDLGPDWPTELEDPLG